jgi:hypothetical protein
MQIRPLTSRGADSRHGEAIPRACLIGVVGRYQLERLGFFYLMAAKGLRMSS